MRNFYIIFFIASISLANATEENLAPSLAPSNSVAVTDASSLEKAPEAKKESPEPPELNKDGYHEYNDDVNGVKVELKALISAGLFQMQNSNYGAGTVDFKNPNIVTHDVFWSEYFITPKTRFTKTLENTSSVYTKVSAVLAATRGQGDGCPISTTSNRPTSIAYEELAGGWKSGKLLATEDAIDMSFGQQCITIGDGFLISLGTINAYKRAAYYLNPRTAFKNTAVLAINTLPVRGQLFHLTSNTNQQLLNGNDQPKTWLVGANIEYVSTDPQKSSTEYWTLGLTLLNLYKATKDTLILCEKNRDGLMVFNPRLGGNFFPSDRNIRFFAGYVYQKNNKIGRKTRASAYYIEPGYTFKDFWGSPLLFYRYSYFSGDSNPNGTTKKSYDPLMNGLVVRDGFGTWETGQIQGFFYLFTNTNQKFHSVQLKVTPSEQYTWGLQYFIVNFDKKQQYNIQSKAGSREIDAYFTWAPDSKFSLTAMTGALTPKAGVKQYTCANSPLANPGTVRKTIYFFSLMLNYTL